MIIAPVINGEVHFNYSGPVGRMDVQDIARKVGYKGDMPDWLVKYTTDKGVDTPRLIHDDYFLAIKMTFNARLYVSAMKLLVSCIDSLAYVEYGHDRKSVPLSRG